MDYLAELQKIEKAAQDGKLQKAKLEQKLTTLQEEQKKLVAELSALGVTEENLQDTITTLSQDIEDAIDEANEVWK